MFASSGRSLWLPQWPNYIQSSVTNINPQNARTQQSAPLNHIGQTLHAPESHCKIFLCINCGCSTSHVFYKLCSRHDLSGDLYEQALVSFTLFMRTGIAQLVLWNILFVAHSSDSHFNVVTRVRGVERPQIHRYYNKMSVDMIVSTKWPIIVQTHVWYGCVHVWYSNSECWLQNDSKTNWSLCIDLQWPNYHTPADAL